MNENDPTEQNANEETREKIRNAAAAGRVELPENITPEYMPVLGGRGIIEFEPEIRNVELTGNAVRIDWKAKNCGFGSLTLWKDEDGNLHKDTEAMGPESCLKILKAWLEASED